MCDLSQRYGLTGHDLHCFAFGNPCAIDVGAVGAVVVDLDEPCCGVEADGTMF